MWQNSNGTQGDGFDCRPDLFVYGIGVEYPTHKVRPGDIAILARRHYSNSKVLDKVLAIDKCTGIESRSTTVDIDHPILNSDTPPSIEKLCDFFLDHGVQLAKGACHKALKQWGGMLSEITHIVATTCTNSANPGFDSYLVKELGLQPNIERVLLHGVGCSGGLAALRTASNVALGSSFRQKPAWILVVACEITSVLLRSELESVHRDQEVRIGATIFSDCASTLILGNGVCDQRPEKKKLELLNWTHSIIEGTERDLSFNVDSIGWKMVLSPNVPNATSAAVPAAFQELVNPMQKLTETNEMKPEDYDWAVHPGGLSVITGVQKALGLTRQHLRATYDIYTQHGNSSSASIFSVLNTLLQAETRTQVVACAFGPGITVETVMFKRILHS